MKMKELLKDKKEQIIFCSGLVGIGITSYVTKTFELDTILVYAALSLAVAKFAKVKKSSTFFLTGAALPIIFNVAGSTLGWFDINITSTLFAALQQGVITFLIAKWRGMK